MLSHEPVSSAPDKSLLVHFFFKKRSKRKYFSLSYVQKLQAWVPGIFREAACDIFNQRQANIGDILPNEVGLLIKKPQQNKQLKKSHRADRDCPTVIHTGYKKKGIFDFLLFPSRSVSPCVNVLFSVWHQSWLKYFNLLNIPMELTKKIKNKTS